MAKGGNTPKKQKQQIYRPQIVEYEEYGSKKLMILSLAVLFCMVLGIIVFVSLIFSGIATVDSMIKGQL